MSAPTPRDRIKAAADALVKLDDPNIGYAMCFLIGYLNGADRIDAAKVAAGLEEALHEQRRVIELVKAVAS